MCTLKIVKQYNDVARDENDINHDLEIFSAFAKAFARVEFKINN